MTMENMVSGNKMDESALIERLREGDQRAINEIVETYKNPLFAFIFRMVNDHSLSEDIFQETWIRVVRHIRSFRGDAKFSTWLFQIAVNLCRDARRKRSRYTLVPIEDHENDFSCDPDVSAEKMIEARQVHALVESLPDKMREVVVLKFFHDLGDDEIAEVIGIPVGTVKTRYYRAYEKMRKKWPHITT